MIKFPSIEQFRNVIRHVQTHARFVGKDENGDAIYDHSKPLPTLKFRGTVKLHGTNAGIVYDVSTDTISYQSRERVLSLTSDNAGFMLTMMKFETELLKYFRGLIRDECLDRSRTDLPEKIAIFGEWCGRGIQKGVAISELDRMFVVFAHKEVYSDGYTHWQDLFGADEGDTWSEEAEKIFRWIGEFPTWEIDIDFNFPEIAQNKMIEITEAVEAECPVGKAFGVSGIGEGVVWTCITPGWTDSGTWFKVKGEKHSSSKVKTLAAVDVEAVENMKAFIESVVTESRLEQGLDNLVREQLLPFEMKSLGDFIRWVYNDVLKEEMDTIVANQIDVKKLGSAVANVARPWYIKKFNEGVSL